ncbi:ribonuclease Z [Ornithinibacillus gellani]|uniref:MBL fold metallo-hydrolase n=1 Tax=Ornithinibacillus gellani TaxID=2293253 RepID=UPI000F47FE66|nr:ribonuclease Z [Ornithinibacillus gellani]TQS75376.1 ribonuclease Z [Ornithinibacillus gellani]
MQIHFLGTGSAFPGAVRDNTSICFSNDVGHVLVDVSGNPCKRLKQIGVELGDLDVVIITHFHIDHIYGLPSLLWGMWLEGRTKALRIYCDERNSKRLDTWMQAMEIADWGIQFEIDIQLFKGEEKRLLFSVGDMIFSSFPAIHSVPTIGLEITFQHKCIVYSCDTEYNPFIKAYPSIDILIHEATSATEKSVNHTSMLEVVNCYSLDLIREVVLVHLSDGEDYEAVRNRMKEREKIIIAEDMLRIEL